MQPPLIVTGPPGAGKSHWIQAYAKETRKQLLTCSCRKDRTLREGRQKLLLSLRMHSRQLDQVLESAVHHERIFKSSELKIE
jgi:chromosomal replication initiation ATPase DnaA